MTGKKNKFITLDQMRDLTSSVLYKTGYPLQWNGMIQAVPIEDIIEIDFGIEWRWGEFDQADDELVMAALYPKRKEIILNVSCRELFREKFGTKLFSLAHELGHWVLHAEDITGMQMSLFEGDVFYCRSNLERSPIEYQADLFAGCLLMPEAIIRPLMKELNAKTMLTWQELYNIADGFQVSISALTTRLQQLNLLYIDRNKGLHCSKEAAMGQQILF